MYPVIILPTLVILFVFLLNFTGMLTPTEHYLVDRRYRMRHLSPNTTEVSPALAVVRIDDQSYSSLEKYWSK